MGRPVRIPVPHSLRKAIPSSDLAEAALANAIQGVGIPRLDLTRLAGVLMGCEGHAVLAAPRSWTDAQLRWAFIVLLHHLGEINGRYGKLFDVQERGVDEKPFCATVSGAKAGTTMRTDSSDAQYNPDLVAFLCLQPGTSVGRIKLANAPAMLGRLRQARPELEPVARTAWPCHVDAPNLESEEKSMTNNAIPMFSEDSSGFVFRYTRSKTERALVKLGQQVPADLMQLFDFIDADMEAHAIRFTLHRGEMLFVNNRTTVHGRESLECGQGMAHRSLVRSWVDGFLDSHAPALSRRA